MRIHGSASQRATCIKDNSTKARGKLCIQEISRGGTEKRAATTALNNHIKNKHPTINLASENDASVKIKFEEFGEELLIHK